MIFKLSRKCKGSFWLTINRALTPKTDNLLLAAGYQIATAFGNVITSRG